MKLRFFLLAVATVLTAGTALADHLSFQSISSQSNVWQGYWTSPYLVMDQSVPPSGDLLTVYCLDFNHEVAPPYNWDATITRSTRAMSDLSCTGRRQMPGSITRPPSRYLRISNSFWSPNRQTRICWKRSTRWLLGSYL